MTKKVNIIGVSCFYHDSAACLVQNGKLIAATEEERFTRKKYDPDFPKRSIDFCLEKGGITEEDIDYVVFYEKPFNKFERILMNSLQFYPKTWSWFTKAIPVWLREKLWFSHVWNSNYKKAKKAQIMYCDHHLSHAASSYFCSDFDEAALLTTDGVGEWTTSALGYAKGNDIFFDRKLEYPHSLGLLYSTMTAFLGFKVNSDEYKVMGLASYGEPKYIDRICKMVDIKEDGSFHLNMDYFAFQHSMVSYSKKFVELFGPPRKPESKCFQYHADLAASVQKVTEEILIKQASTLYEKYKCKNLCMAGGVALNCVANGRIFRETPFEEIYVQPAAGDAGGAVGAAFYVYNHVLDNKERFRLEDVYLGSDFSDDEIREFLDSHEILYERFDDKRLVEVTAEAITNGNVIGWFQGRQEFGPRALGHRSILADPTNLEMQNILNAKIKHRELFRPFAPSVLKEHADDYFELEGKESPFMLIVAPVKDEHKYKLPAITHVDGSARIQTVDKNVNEKYYNLIKEIGDRNGYYLTVNTSFNVRGEPIVRTPEEAYNCFMKTEMDVLVLGNYYLTKKYSKKKN